MTAMQDIQPIHTCVPGRARFKVPGLMCNADLKTHLEYRLPGSATITQARANPANASLVVRFDPATELGTVISGILASLANLCQPTAIPGSEQKVKDLSPDASGSTHTWHKTSIKRSVEYLQTSQSQGLSRETALERLQQTGPNVLPEPEAKSRWAMFSEQFKSLPVALLGAAAGLSMVTGGILDAVVISGVIVANSIIGYATESQSEKAIESLRSIAPPPVRVLRNGAKTKVHISELVPGDLLVLQPGTYVGADARIIEANNLTVDESSLTGESLPVEKNTKSLSKKDVPLAERSNMAFMGTVVTGGHGRALVVATGRETEMGHLHQELVCAERPRPPIEKKLAKTGDQLVSLWAGVCGCVFVLGLVRGFSPLTMLGLSVSLAAAAVPEGLPAAATTTFALGMKRMRQHGIMVRQLEAVETLGSVQIICFDKTGTITRNQMQAEEIFTGGRRILRQGAELFEGETALHCSQLEELHQILSVSALCSQVKINGNGDGSTELEGSSTENALVQLAMDQGLDVKAIRKRHALLQVNHRSQKSPIMSTLHATEGSTYLHAVKGSPLEVLDLCEKQMKDDEVVPLTEADREAIRAENSRMAQKAYRVLGTATRSLERQKDLEKKNGFVWLGLIAMADPLREGVAGAVQSFHRAGIKTVMITGDQRQTAQAVATDLDLSQGAPLHIMDATEIDQLSPQELTRRANEVHVFARVSPTHKLKIVQALQQGGQIVAMTGDGVNDGPALKAADVGIAMGDGGTDVARDVADVILEYDHLDSMIQAINDGRTTYTNIHKSVHFFLSTNFSETMLMTGAIAAGVGSPLTSMQLLWINLISDIFPGLSLSMEPQDPKVLTQPPRDPDAPFFSNQDYLDMTKESGVITANTLGAYAFGLLRYGPGLHAGALAFHSLTLSQLVHTYSCRSESKNGQRKKQGPNPWLHAAVGGSIGMHLLTMVVPALRSFLNLTPLCLIDLGVILGSTVSSFGLNEMLKSNRSESGQKAHRLVKNPSTGTYEYQSSDGRKIAAAERADFINHSALQASTPLQ